MKVRILVTALTLAISSLGQAQEFNQSVDYQVIWTATIGQPALYPNPLAEPGALGRLALSFNTSAFPNPYPIGPYTAGYTLPGGWLIESAPGSSEFEFGGAHDGTVTDNHPSWDALAFTADTSMQGALSSGETFVGAAALVLTDPDRTALASTALLPTPPFTAFASGEVAVAFGTMADESASYPGGSTLVLGRVTPSNGNPDRPTYRCQGFAAPAQQAIRLRADGRRLLLSAVLADQNGTAVGTAGLLSRPIIRVLRTRGGGFGFVTDLAADDGSFYYRGGRWQHRLLGRALPGPGTYLVYLTTPDHNEYVIEPLCSVEVTVQ